MAVASTPSNATKLAGFSGSRRAATTSEETQGLAISSRLSGHRSCPAKCQVRCSPAELRSDFRE
jgi:hypothetical protein